MVISLVVIRTCIIFALTKTDYVIYKIVSWLELNLTAPQILANPPPTLGNSSFVSNSEQQPVKDKIVIPSGSAGGASGRIIRILSPSFIRIQEVYFEMRPFETMGILAPSSEPHLSGQLTGKSRLFWLPNSSSVYQFIQM